MDRRIGTVGVRAGASADAGPFQDRTAPPLTDAISAGNCSGDMELSPTYVATISIIDFLPRIGAAGPACTGLRRARSADRQQHAITDRARAVAPEELDPGYQLGAHRDQAGTGRRGVGVVLDKGQLRGR
jgi:hypothetical protein